MIPKNYFDLTKTKLKHITITKHLTPILLLALILTTIYIFNSFTAKITIRIDGQETTKRAVIVAPINK